jgi:hypothetical protein
VRRNLHDLLPVTFAGYRLGFVEGERDVDGRGDRRGAPRVSGRDFFPGGPLTAPSADVRVWISVGSEAVTDR